MACYRDSFTFFIALTRLRSWKACCKLLHSAFPLKEVQIKLYEAIVLSVVLYGYEIWSLTVREEGRMTTMGRRR
jgi:hypothetical protein